MTAASSMRANAGDSLEGEVRAMQFAHLAQQVPLHATGNVVNSALTAAIFWSAETRALLAGWVLCFAVAAAIQLRRWWLRRRRLRPAGAPSRRSARRATLWAAFAGTLWGTAGLILFPPAAPALQMFLSFVIGGTVAGAVASMSSVPSVCLAFVFPALLPLIGQFLAAGQPGSWAMAAMTALYLGILTAAVWNGHRSFVAMVQAKLKQAALEAGLARAQEVSRVKSEFLAKMSHELRTPLHAIIGFAELIASGGDAPDRGAQHREHAGDIQASAVRLLNVLNDILDLSRVATGEQRLNIDAVDLPRVVALCCRGTRAEAEAAGVALACHPPEQAIPAIRADEHRIRQVLQKLLANAVTYTPAGGAVAVTVARTGPWAEVTVADTGVGMTESQIAEALEPFRQLDNSLARRFPGAGLGLPLAKALAELHGGMLDIRSAPGRGTAVTLRLPLGEAARPAGAGTAAAPALAAAG